jgi:DNA-binding transcriptional MerR regulator
MKLPDLIALVASRLERGPERVTPRFVRFLIAEGVIDGPGGTRARPEYSQAQARGVLDYLRLRDLGLSLEDARSLVRGGGAGRFRAELGPGLLLIVDPAALDPATSPPVIAARVVQALESILAARTKDPADDA